jgi:hypothetical protein
MFPIIAHGKAYHHSESFITCRGHCVLQYPRSAPTVQARRSLLVELHNPQCLVPAENDKKKETAKVFLH